MTTAQTKRHANFLELDAVDIDAGLLQLCGVAPGDARRLVATLTPREREVAGLMVRGMRNKDIATALGISPKTLDIHRAQVMHKFGANTPIGVALVWIAARGGAVLRGETE